MLNAWAYYLAVQEWSDLSLISKNNQFQSLNCFNESGGVVSHGWGCLFRSMPHVCVFDTTEVRFGSCSWFILFSSMIVVRSEDELYMQEHDVML